MRKLIFLIAVLCISIAANEGICAEALSNLTLMKFEQLNEKAIRVQTEGDEYEEHLATVVNEEVSREPGIVHGNFVKLVHGVVGNAIRYDGYTTYITIDAKNAPKVSGAFSVEAWIALGAYPKSWTPIINQCNEEDCGYSLEISSLGKLGFKVGASGKLQELISKENIELNKWTHVAGVYSPEDGIKIYVNGEEVGSRKVGGDFHAATELEVLIGRSRVMHKPDGTIRPNATAIYCWMSLRFLRVQLKAIKSPKLIKRPRCRLRPHCLSAYCQRARKT
jgi:hypothetical protein